MKPILIAVFFILSYQNNIISSQTDSDDPILYIYADKLPKLIYEGGLKKYLNENLQWPSKFDGQGTVIVSFVIQASGKIKDLKIEKSLVVCDEEVIRVFSSMPDWLPGELDSKPVDMKLYFPVEFKLK